MLLYYSIPRLEDYSEKMDFEQVDATSYSFTEVQNYLDYKLPVGEIAELHVRCNH